MGGRRDKYVVIQVVLTEKLLGTGSGTASLTNLQAEINKQAAKGDRLHTISTTSSGSKGFLGGEKRLADGLPLALRVRSFLINKDKIQGGCSGFCFAKNTVKTYGQNWLRRCSCSFSPSAGHFIGQLYNPDWPTDDFPLEGEYNIGRKGDL